MRVDKLRGVVLDMDGVLWRGNEPLPGLIALFDWLRARNMPYALATNNSTTSPQDYAAKLAGMGVPDVPPERIITSSTATAAYLRDHYPVGTRVYMLGGAGLRNALTGAGFEIVEADAEVVVSGLDRELTYAKLTQAALLIRAGAAFIGTNPDRTFPAAHGIVPGAGSILAALIAATDVQPIIIGKPYPPMLTAALALLNTPAAQTLMIGDRLDTDIAGAQQVGMLTALVLTGVTTRAELAANAIQPDFVYEGLPEFLEVVA